MGDVATYERDRDRWAFYADSYWGGLRYRTPSSTTIGTAKLYRYRYVQETSGDGPTELIVSELAKQYPSYLVPHDGERPTEFEKRMSLAACVNLCSPIVDAYADAVTARVSRSPGSLAPYLENLDGRGRTWPGIVEEVARWSCVYGWCATVLDSASAAQATSSPRDLRVLLVHPPAIAWLEVDYTGEVLELAIASEPYQPQDVTGTSYQVRLIVWDRQGWRAVGGSVSGRKPLGDQRAALSTLLDSDGVPLRGELPEALRGRVPVTFAFFREVTTSRFPVGVSVIEDAADLQRQIVNELSWIEEIHRKTAFPFLAVPTSSKGGALDPSTKLQIGPDTALGFTSDTGVPQWVQPTAESTRELREHCQYLMAQALRSAGLEVAADASAQVQSGEALRIRSRDFESRAARFARALARWERTTLALAADYVGATGEDVSVTYPTRYVLPDVQEDLARSLLLVQTVPEMLDPETRRLLLRQAVGAALAVDDEELDAVEERLEAKDAEGQGAGEIFGYDLDAGVVTVNEVRARKGLGPIAGGEEPVLEWVERIKLGAEVARLRAGLERGAAPQAGAPATE